MRSLLYILQSEGIKELAGADYDMSGSGPGDLDPHAVASVFKAYLREREYYE